MTHMTNLPIPTDVVRRYQASLKKFSTPAKFRAAAKRSSASGYHRDAFMAYVKAAALEAELPPVFAAGDALRRIEDPNSPIYTLADPLIIYTDPDGSRYAVALDSDGFSHFIHIDILEKVDG